MADQLSPEKILGLGFGFWNAKTLLSAVELGLFTILAEAPADAETLRSRLGLHPRSALDFFDALVALGLLERDNGLYRNTAEAALFLDRAKPSYVGQILELANARLFASWDRLTEALKTGRPQSENAAEKDFFAALYADPARLRGFLTAMSGISAGPAKAIAEKFPWTKYGSFVDVGSAQGMVPATVARAHPHLIGAGFDLPQVKPIFDDFIAANGLSDRVTFRGGDFFRDALPGADVIVMGHILHDWDLEEKRHLLANAYAALPKGGALIVYEALIDDERRTNAFGLLMSLNMLIETPGGFDYTGADCQGWMREAGFAETRVEHLLGPDSMVIGVK
ncbi:MULTISPECIES: methyltransferase [Methylosinus]|uniref:Methyltransferase n=1 Tax=Methylosinus trichosporium (strain ATCC 35070 / NCIMB 11131 / UNIQEM 75 / OB3b) TaxID=595536 RepID=A0A2D2CW30_METT3|nr:MULTISPECIES: methyltransferase [Methylosinus]ATQ66849.1 methyltransferase [Methylosinus trichosporium OB3b]OBS54279.1 methyltransferase [Methylosinus sp. 3S-1]